MSGSDEEEFEIYLEAMRRACARCEKKITGASWSGRCFLCHNDMLMPYESGEDYIGIGRDYE